MRLQTLDQLRPLRLAAMSARKLWLEWRCGVQLHPTARVSLTARFRCAKRGAVRIGARSQITFRTLFTTRDPRTGRVAAITVGDDCFIGGGSLIGPGVTIGDGAIVGAGAIVLDDVPPRSVVAGNPARVIRSDTAAARSERGGASRGNPDIPISAA